MGEVYLAKDNSLDRTVAIKILPPEVGSDPDRLRRFTQEARAASALSEPEVAHIYEIGESYGVRFIVMEYVDGETLEARLKRPIDIPEILSISVQIAEALHAAHSHNIVHRDIKPANVMLTSRGRVKVLDFGLARREPEATDSAASAMATQGATEPGMVLGTVLYMSPEQALGKRVDARSDLFSFGVVLYQMAAGRLPFQGNSPTEIINSIVNAQPESVARFNYSVTPELEHVIRKLLEKDPDNRYQSARELIVDLRNLHRDTISGTAKVAPYSAASAHKTLQRFAAIVVAAVVIVIAFWWFQFHRTHTAAQAEIDSLAVLPFVNASKDPGNEYLSDGLSESIIKNLSQIGRLKVLAPATVFRYKGPSVDPIQAGRDLKVKAILTGKLQQESGQLVISADLINVTDGSEIWGGTYNKPVSGVLELQETISREISENLRFKLTGKEQTGVARVYTTNPEAYQLYLKGRYYWNKRTEETLKKGIDYFEQAIASDPNYALAYSGIADSYCIDSGPAPYQERLEKSKAAALKAVQLDPNMAESHASLGCAAGVEGDNETAIRELRKAISLNPNYATAHQWLAETFLATKNLPEAVDEIQKAYSLDPLSLIINNTMGSVCLFAGKFDEAVTSLRRSVELYPESAGTRFWLVRVLECKHEIPAAIEEGVAFLRLIHKPESELSSRKRLLETSYARGGEKGYWETKLQFLLQADAYYETACAYAQLGDSEKTFEFIEKAFQQQKDSISILNVDPRFDSIRSDPRYIEYCKRLNLVP